MTAFLIVGPSGSGKDSLINYACQQLPIQSVKRVITRPNNNFEDFESVKKTEFKPSNFLIHWEVFDKKYGIPILNSGKDYLVNISRSKVTEFKQAWPDTIVIELYCPKEVLRERLIKRGRDSLEEIKKRLAREIKVNSDYQINSSNPNVSVAGEKLINYLSSRIH